jgi:hypothetical protein
MLVKEVHNRKRRNKSACTTNAQAKLRKDRSFVPDSMQVLAKANQIVQEQYLKKYDKAYIN